MTLNEIFFSPKSQIYLSWFMLVASIILWPLSMLTFAKNEPPFILSLSWFAIIISAYNTILTAKVNKDINVDVDVDKVEINNAKSK